jgi:hypothetical protein
MYRFLLAGWDLLHPLSVLQVATRQPTLICSMYCSLEVRGFHLSCLVALVIMEFGSCDCTGLNP